MEGKHRKCDCTPLESAAGDFDTSASGREPVPLEARLRERRRI